MIWVHRFCLIVLFANVGVWMWAQWRPEPQLMGLPLTEPGIPSLILHQEYLQLQQSKQRSAPGVCWQIGPFADQAVLRRAWQSLEYITLDMQRRKSLTVTGAGYRLTVPASAGRKEADLLRESLLSAGWKSAVVRTDFSIDAGLYGDLDSAQSQQRVAQQLGIEMQLRAEQQSREAWWIDASIRNRAGFEQWLTEQTPRIPAQRCP